jgi:hypothetical protein
MKQPISLPLKLLLYCKLAKEGDSSSKLIPSISISYSDTLSAKNGITILLIS